MMATLVDAGYVYSGYAAFDALKNVKTKSGFCELLLHCYWQSSSQYSVYLMIDDSLMSTRCNVKTQSALIIDFEI
jgi:hypothetical protein